MRQHLAAVVIAGALAVMPHAQAPQTAGGEEIIVASGNLQLKGLLWRPTSDAPAPAVLFHHGGGCANAPNPAAVLGPRFAERGYVFLGLYRRGAGLSKGQGECAFEQIPRVRVEKGGEAALDLQLQLMNTTELDDALAGLAAIRRLQGVDTRRIVVAGHSFGGQLALLTAERESSIKAAMAFAGAAAVWDRAAKIRERLMQAAAGAKVPLFLAYAEDDNAEPGRALGAELTRLGKTHQLGIYPSGGHGFIFRADHPSNTDMFVFLSKYVHR